MTRQTTSVRYYWERRRHGSLIWAVVCLSFILAGPAICRAGEDQRNNHRQKNNQGATSVDQACRLLADRQLDEPIRAIVKEYRRRGGAAVTIQFLAAAEVESLVEKNRAGCDVVASMAANGKSITQVSRQSGAMNIAWKYPSGEPVWAAMLGEHPGAPGLLEFLGGPVGHQLWSDSKAGFTITSGKTHAEAFDWVVEQRVQHTYPLTAMRMLRECGGIRDGVCIDIGCGTGNLDVELAKRSNLKIIGLDIDPDMKQLFNRQVREAGLEDRLRFVVGDAQALPFEDDSADIIVSRGTLTFIPDIAMCLREVNRVLKPTGVAFLGGRYLYTPRKHKITTDQFRQIVRESGVAGATVIDERGQWVKILGPQLPAAAKKQSAGPSMLPHRIIADHEITHGKCLLVCTNDSTGQQELQRGLAEISDLAITALYPSQEVAEAAGKRIGDADLTSRVATAVGRLEALPFEDASFDLVIGIGPVLIWGEREQKMREVHRVLRSGGVALIGGRYLGMPAARRVSSETLRASAAKTGILSVRVTDEMGQWVEIHKGS